MKDLQDQLLYQEKEIPQIHSCKILKEEKRRRRERESENASKLP